MGPAPRTSMEPISVRLGIAAFLLTQEVRELLIQKVTVPWSWAGLGVELHGEDWPILHAQALDGPVEERGMRFLDAERQRLPEHGEAVILRCDLDAAGREVLNRMVATSVTERQLRRASTESEGEQLVPKADAKNRQFRGEQIADHGNCIGAGRGGIAGTIGQNYPIRAQGKNRRGARARWHDRDAAAELGEAPQDVALDTVVDTDDVAVRALDLAVAVSNGPQSLGPFIGLRTRYLARQVHAFKARPLRRGSLQLRHFVVAVGVEGEAPLGGTEVANASDQAPSVHSGDA